MTDTIADMLTRIRNAVAVKKDVVILPASKQKMALVKLLVNEGWLKDFKEKEMPGNKKDLIITLKYLKNGQPAILHIKRVSKPSRRVYVSKKLIPQIRSGHGMAVISTSKGLMSNVTAKKAGLGGEIICEIY